MSNIYTEGRDFIKNKLKTRLLENYSADTVDDILSSAFNSDPFIENTNKLNTDFKRNFIKKIMIMFILRQL